VLLQGVLLLQIEGQEGGPSVDLNLLELALATPLMIAILVMMRLVSAMTYRTFSRRKECSHFTC